MGKHTYEVLRSYMVTELHSVEAHTADEAMGLVSADTYVESYDGDYMDDYIEVLNIQEDEA